MNYDDQLVFAQSMDEKDPLKGFRDQFYIPKQKNGNDQYYFTGNSLGLQPKQTKDYILQELKDWQELGSKGHVMAKRPWMFYQHNVKKALADIVGAKQSEVVCMNSLTTNLHLLMVSFYRPTKEKYKILMLNNAFPSDQYALASQVAFHGYDPSEALIKIGPETSESIVDEEKLYQVIQDNKDSLALVLIEGVSYLTGQFFDIKALGKVCQKHNITLGLDLAHSVGNTKLSLHDDGVDFAVWCSYKYLNGSPGSVAGAFLHEKHAKRKDLPRFSGWWGHNEKRRFLMEKEFDAIEGVDGWQLSNVPIMSCAALLASLDIFEKATMDALVEKSKNLTGYLQYMLEKKCASQVRIITPKDSAKRGCQLSLEVAGGKQVFDHLIEQGVMCDWREPNVIRLAPVPLYNRFEDVYHFVRIISEVL